MVVSKKLLTDGGGPAFPWNGQGTFQAFPGMSLRDWFAGQALTGVLANLSEMSPDIRKDVDKFARDCYRMADAMLKAREA